MMTGVSAEEDTDANDLPKGNQTAASSKGNPGQQGQSVRVRPVQTTDFSKNSEGPGTQPTATGPKTPGVIALPKVPRLSPDEFITVGALAGQKITELPFHTLEDWIKKAEEHFGNSGIDPATSTTDVSRSYRSAKTHIASQATGAFEQDTGGGRLPQEP